jgi:hypothetical protein
MTREAGRDGSAAARRRLLGPPARGGRGRSPLPAPPRSAPGPSSHSAGTGVSFRVFHSE